MDFLSFQCPTCSRDMTKLYEDVYISELRGALQRITNDFTIDEAGSIEHITANWLVQELTLSGLIMGDDCSPECGIQMNIGISIQPVGIFFGAHKLSIYHFKQECTEYRVPFIRAPRIYKQIQTKDFRAGISYQGEGIMKSLSLYLVTVTKHLKAVLVAIISRRG